ncbi:hypothetical protein P9112_009318 [Eukaryota sp. TZLM1-RC]
MTCGEPSGSDKRCYTCAHCQQQGNKATCTHSLESPHKSQPSAASKPPSRELSSLLKRGVIWSKPSPPPQSLFDELSQVGAFGRMLRKISDEDLNKILSILNSVDSSNPNPNVDEPPHKRARTVDVALDPVIEEGVPSEEEIDLSI